jgi:hypothetical protein
VRRRLDAIDAAAWGTVAWALVKMLRPLVGALVRSARPSRSKPC